MASKKRSHPDSPQAPSSKVFLKSDKDHEAVTIGECWKKFPDELKIKVFSFLPIPEKFRKRRISKEWNTLLQDKDVWANNTCSWLILSARYWSADGQKYNQRYSPSDPRCLWDKERIVRCLNPHGGSLELLDFNGEDGCIEAGNLETLKKRLEECENSGLVSLTLLNLDVVVRDHDQVEEARAKLAHLVQSQPNLERLVLGPFTILDENAFTGFGQKECLNPKTLNLMPLPGLEPLSNLRVLILYSVSAKELYKLSPAVLSRLQFFAIYQFPWLLELEAQAILMKKAPHLKRDRDKSKGLVWTAGDKAEALNKLSHEHDSSDSEQEDSEDEEGDKSAAINSRVLKPYSVNIFRKFRKAEKLDYYQAGNWRKLRFQDDIDIENELEGSDKEESDLDDDEAGWTRG